LAPDEVQQIHDQVAANEKYELTIDLESKTVTDGKGFTASFEIDDFRRQCFLEGLDHIALTLKQVDKITAFENARGLAAVK
jgi:3-isopropylmalate/(R)-2-methylmalate dehydratase small subunit